MFVMVMLLLLGHVCKLSEHVGVHFSTEQYKLFWLLNHSRSRRQLYFHFRYRVIYVAIYLSAYQ